VREAGLRTSWQHPDPAFEGSLRRAVDHACADDGARATIDDLTAVTEDAADRGALAQLLAQLFAPGVPDLYQGAEGWDRSLVDPDNRRPPDVVVAEQLVHDAAVTDAAAAWADPGRRRSGLPRTIVIRTALQARRRHSVAVGPDPEGGYHPLDVRGDDARRVIAFARGAEPILVVVVARPGSGRLAGAEVALPEGRWTDAFTGAVHCGSASLGELHAGFPVALLER
jgi:(1->4)-alpha-D-glucan 1-alpha-D-glucosylmutase